MEIKHISSDKVKKNENPVFIIVYGIDDKGDNVIVYVNSNNIKKHFIEYVNQ